ncbi:MAG: hypothetical protein RIS09_855 [Actinomycetota bacterium]
MNQEWIDKDYYQVLGVSKTASQDEIKKKYRQLAKELHPDANPGNQKAEARFKEVSEAYDVVGNEQSRREYDEFRDAVASGAFAGGFPGGGYTSANFEDVFQGGFGDIFGSIFGGGGRTRARRGNDIETTITVSFADSLQGIITPIGVTGDFACKSCKGSGAAAGSQRKTCGGCGGSGQVVRNVGGFGVPQTCNSCRGNGYTIDTPCGECRGVGAKRETKTFQIKIPRGVKDGATLRHSGFGAAGSNGGHAGDLFVRVKVTPHPIFTRKDDSLEVTVPISIVEATLGAEIEVPMVSGGTFKLKVPAGTPSGKKFRVKNKGFMNAKGKLGDVVITVEIAVPQKLSKTAKAALQDFAKATEDEHPRTEFLERAASAPRISVED